MRQIFSCLTFLVLSVNLNNVHLYHYSTTLQEVFDLHIAIFGKVVLVFKTPKPERQYFIRLQVTPYTQSDILKLLRQMGYNA